MNKEGKAATRSLLPRTPYQVTHSIKITPSGVPEAGTCGIIQKLFGTAGSFSSVSLLVIARNETSTLVFFHSLYFPDSNCFGNLLTVFLIGPLVEAVETDGRGLASIAPPVF